ncbi:2OG-Fe(II) oxygenase [Polyangium jinanense]|uniref:2OG-Fe(II) oxygenase n=2 Tax=Polyangium jinanense TaxID=2829994 RepID=A0A9X4APF0_9BACT|nr:2OG-Fe(II) oxygenase [Polyangium jinanense]
MNGHDCAHASLRFGGRARALRVSEVDLDGCEIGFGRGERVRVAFVEGEQGERMRIVEPALGVRDPIVQGAETCSLREELFRTFAVAPEVGFAEKEVEFGEAPGLPGEVKDRRGAGSGVDEARRGVRGWENSYVIVYTRALTPSKASRLPEEMSMKSRTHISFRREETFRAVPHRLDEVLLDEDRAVAVRREDVETGVYLLHGVMSPKECKRLITTAEAIGFTHAGLAIGNDTYRVNLAARNNLRVVLDAERLAEGLWARIRGHVDTEHEASPLVGLNDRFRVYRYEVGQRFSPHLDVRTAVPRGETRASLMIYLNEGFEGGSTRFFEEKDKKSRRGEGRGRKFNNRVRFAVRPAPGSVVVFDHLLLHEGAEVTAGVKYAVRSDLIYAPSR